MGLGSCSCSALHSHVCPFWSKTQTIFVCEMHTQSVPFRPYSNVQCSKEAGEQLQSYTTNYMSQAASHAVRCVGDGLGVDVRVIPTYTVDVHVRPILLCMFCAASRMRGALHSGPLQEK